jgi:virulence factor Mce-like protein
MNTPRLIAYLAAGIGVIVLAVVALGGSSGGYLVRAEFKDAGGLRKDSSVKVAGVTGGTVQSISVTPQDTAIVTIKLDPGAAPIGSGASIEVRPTDLLGERYAQLNVGNLNDPQPSGSLIPASRTSDPVELDDVLNTFAPDIRMRMRILVNEAGLALAGRGADFNTLLSELPPDLGQAQQLLGQVASENQTLATLISQGDRITSVVNAKRNDLGSFIHTAEQALGVVAAKQTALAATLQTAPGGLQQLHTALDDVGSAATAITPAAIKLQAAAGPLATTLNALPDFANSANATLVTAKNVAPDLIHLATRARTPLNDLRGTASHLNTVMSASAPLWSELDQRGMHDLLWFVENWAVGLKARDAFGHLVGGNLSIDPSTLTSALNFYEHNVLGAAKAAAQKAKPAVAPQPVLPPSITTAVSKVLGGAPANAITSVKKLLTGVLGGVNKSVAPTVNAVVGAVQKVTSGVLGGVSNTLNSLHLGGQSSSPPSGGSSQSNDQASSSAVNQLLNFLLGK